MENACNPSQYKLNHHTTPSTTRYCSYSMINGRKNLIQCANLPVVNCVYRIYLNGSRTQISTYVAALE